MNHEQTVIAPYTPAPGAQLQEIDTPFVAVDLDAVEANIDSLMAKFRDYRNINVRPHLKTAKSPYFAELMLERGARGICVAKISEAEIFADAGIEDILITTEIAGSLKISRLVELKSRCSGLKIVVDCSNMASILSEACSTRKLKLDVLIDLNVGQNRTGVGSIDEARRLAEAIAKLKNLNLIGIQGYEGHLQHLDSQEKEKRCRQAMALLASAARSLREDGHKLAIVTTGGTGTAEICASCPEITEVQPGSFIFMDAAYKRATNRAFKNALTIWSTVISKPAFNRVVIDAGTKTLSVDMGHAEPVNQPDWTYRPAGDEHGIVESADGPLALSTGDRIELIPSHIDTTIALHDQYYLIRNNKLVDTVAIATRGKVQ